MPVNSLEISKTVKYFGEFKVLDELNLTVSPGVIFGLIGPNGAGKTTTIKCIADLLELDEGVIKIFDKDIHKDGIEIKKDIGFLFEETSDLFVFLKGEEQLQFVGEIYGLSKKEMLCSIFLRCKLSGGL